MKILNVEGDFTIYNSHICRNCIVYEVTLRELLHKLGRLLNDITMEYLREFFALARILTPDHPSLDNIEFYFVSRKTGSYRNYIDVYIVFSHFEHDSVYDLQSIITIMYHLMAAFDSDEAYLQEFHSNSEYMVIRVPLKNTRLLASLVYAFAGSPVDVISIKHYSVPWDREKSVEGNT